jgi:hypothetical protein
MGNLLVVLQGPSYRLFKRNSLQQSINLWWQMCHPLSFPFFPYDRDFRCSQKLVFHTTVGHYSLRYQHREAKRRTPRRQCNLQHTVSLYLITGAHVISFWQRREWSRLASLSPPLYPEHINHAVYYFLCNLHIPISNSVPARYSTRTRPPHSTLILNSPGLCTKFWQLNSRTNISVQQLVTLVSWRVLYHVSIIKQFCAKQ